MAFMSRLETMHRPDAEDGVCKALEMQRRRWGCDVSANRRVLEDLSIRAVLGMQSGAAIAMQC